MEVVRAHVGNLDLRGSFAETGFIITEIEGWESQPELRVEKVDLAQAHGEYDLPTFFSARTVTINGVAKAQSAEQLKHMQAQLTGLLAPGASTVKLTVTEPGVTSWANVRLASKTLWVTNGTFPDIADWQLQLRAADPRKYGETRSFVPAAPATPVDVFHYGNFPASPIITVTGSGAAPYGVYGTDDRNFIVTADLVTGHPHVIDVRRGRLSIDGSVIFGGLSAAEPWSVPGGVQVSHHLDPNGNTASMVVKVTDTFL